MSRIPFHSHEVAVLETLGAAGDGVWEDLRFPASAVNPPGLVSDPDLDPTTGLYLFDAASTELIYIFVQMPHSWKEGSEISPHVHWQKTTSAAGDVLWRMRYKKAPLATVMDADWSTPIDVTTPVPDTPDIDTANYHMISAFNPDIDMTGLQISDCILFEVSRIGGDAADTYGADARLLEFDVHYQSDSAGSTHEFIKQTRPFDNR